MKKMSFAFLNLALLALAQASGDDFKTDVHSSAQQPSATIETPGPERIDESRYFDGVMVRTDPVTGILSQLEYKAVRPDKLPDSKNSAPSLSPSTMNAFSEPIRFILK
jgi:hypothetical protein